MSWSAINTEAPPPSIASAEQSYWWVAPFAILDDTWVLARPVAVPNGPIRDADIAPPSGGQSTT